MTEIDRVWVYILECSDGSYCVGSARTTPERRVAEHMAGLSPKAYTFTRRPVRLVYAESFARITDAIAAERRIKGWSRDKKRALVAGRLDLMPALARRGRTTSGA